MSVQFIMRNPRIAESPEGIGKIFRAPEISDSDNGSLICEEPSGCDSSAKSSKAHHSHVLAEVMRSHRVV